MSEIKYFTVPDDHGVQKLVFSLFPDRLGDKVKVETQSTTGHILARIIVDKDAFFHIVEQITTKSP